MKRDTNPRANLKGDAGTPPSAPSANPAGKNPRDARGDQSKLAKNRKDLGVEEDHKTKAMERSGRGTFP